MSQLIKQDINLLEYPLYTLTKKNIRENLDVVIEGKEYSLLVGYKPPNSVDILYLYYFIKILQDNDYPKKFYVKQSELIKEVSKGCSTFYYSRIRETLKIWRNIGISFKGSFYDGKKYKAMEFGVLDYGNIEDDGEIVICFNEIFLSVLKNTNFYRYLNFSEFKKLRKPVSRRLYEILSKSTFPFKIDILKLANKMPLKQVFPSQIVREIKPAVKEINECTDLKIVFSCKKNSSGHTICTFENKNEQKNSITISSVSIPEEKPLHTEPDLTEHQKLFNMLPEECKTETNNEIIMSFLAKGFNFNYIESNIKYSKINSKKNFSLYFSKALEMDYASSFRQESVLKTKIKSNKQELEDSKRKREQEIAELNINVNQFVSTLSEDTYKKYEHIAIQVLIEEWKNKGFNDIAVKEKIPSLCIKQKIHELFCPKK